MDNLFLDVAAGVHGGGQHSRCGLMVVDGLFANTPIIWGMLASLVVFVVVSRLTPRPFEESMRARERRLEGSDAPP